MVGNTEKDNTAEKKTNKVKKNHSQQMKETSKASDIVGGKPTKKNNKDKMSEYSGAVEGGDEMKEKQDFEAAEDKLKKKQRSKVKKHSHELGNENDDDMVKIDHEQDVHAPSRPHAMVTEVNEQIQQIEILVDLMEDIGAKSTKQYSRGRSRRWRLKQ